MTERLYYTDAQTRRFTGRVVEGGSRVVLDRTAFYPNSGGQPNDVGRLGGVAVVDVVEEEDGRIVHVLEGALEAGLEVEGEVEAGRRWDHTQQHSGQHLLSAVFEELFQARTVSFHLGAESSTIDLEIGALSAEQVRAAERRANEVVCEDRAVRVDFEDAATAQGLRKESGRTGELRIVTIADYDRSACGGTHVQRTGEIGPILLRKLDKIRSTVRVEFLCGARATERARADYEALSQIARQFSSALDETPAAVAAAMEKSRELEKEKRRLMLDLAALRGRELYGQAAADGAGVRRYVERVAGALGDDVRALAQSFCAGERALFAAVGTTPATVLVCASADSGVHAGNALKAALAAAGGRGGGNAALAQGTLASAEAVATALAALGF